MEAHGEGIIIDGIALMFLKTDSCISLSFSFKHITLQRRVAYCDVLRIFDNAGWYHIKQRF